MTQGYLLAVSMPHLGMFGLFIAPSASYRGFTSDKWQARRYASKREAFAAAMALTEGRLVSPKAILEPVPLVVEGA